MQFSLKYFSTVLLPEGFHHNCQSLLLPGVETSGLTCSGLPLNDQNILRNPEKNKRTK